MNLFIGSAFWKVSSRKVYAVTKGEIKNFRHRFSLDSDVEEDFQPPATKRISSCNSQATFQKIEDGIKEVLETIKDIRRFVQNIISVLHFWMFWVDVLNATSVDYCQLTHP